MATFVQMSEGDQAYDLVILLNDLSLSKEEREAKAKQQADSEDPEVEDEKEVEDAKASKFGQLVVGGELGQLLQVGVLASMEQLLSCDEDTIDSGFSLAFSMLSRVAPAAQEPLVVAFTSVLAKDTAHVPLLRLSLLGVLFNLAQPAQRYPIFMAILQFAVAINKTELLVGQFDHMDAWLAEWKLGPEQLAALYYIVQSMVKDEKKAQGHKIKYLRSMEHSKGRNGPEVTAVAVSVCVAAIQFFKENVEDFPCFDCSRLLAIATVQDLAKEKKHAPLLELVTIFASKHVSDYIAFYKTNTQYIADLGLSHEDNLAKLRTVTVCSLGMDHEKLSFKQLMESLELKDENEVEAAIIEAVMSGRLQAKIDQEKGEVLVQRTTQRSFSNEDWARLSRKLDGWRDNVGSVLANLHNIQMGPEAEVKEE